MRLPTRLILVGITSLTGLSVVHWYRRQNYRSIETTLYFIGALPNFLAAVAIPFIFLAIWNEQDLPLSQSVLRRKFIVLNLVSGIGLIVWEFLQRSSRTLVFDYHDILATICGALFAWLLFLLVMVRKVASQ